MEAAAHPWPTLGVLILRDGLVSKEQLEAILNEQRDSRHQRMSGHRLGEILINRGLVTATDVAKLVAEQYELPFAELDTADVDLGVARRFTEELARRLSAVPVSAHPDGSCLLAIADPGTVLFSDELRKVLGAVPRFVVVGPDALESAIAFVFDGPTEPSSELETADTEYSEANVVELRPESPAQTFALYETPPIALETTSGHPPLGALLVREGLVTQEELDTALAQQRLSTSWRLGEILVSRGIVTSSAVARLIAKQYELPFVDLPYTYVDPVVATRLPKAIAREFPAVPIAAHADGSLQVAIADPTNVYYSDELQGALGVPLSFVVAAPDAIDAVIESAHDSARESEGAGEAQVDAEAPIAWAGFDDASSTAVDTDENAAEGDDPPDYLEHVVVDDVSEEVVDEIEELPEFLEGVAFVDATTAEVVTVEPEVLPDLVKDVSEEVVAGEIVVEEPSLGWVPTWTTEIELVDEVELDDQPEAADATAEELPDALLAEVRQSEAPAFADDVEEPLETTVAARALEHGDEVTPQEPASVTAFVEYAHGEDDAGEAGETASAPEELGLEDAGSTPVVDDVDAAIEQVLTRGASAIHFSPRAGEYIVRARIDGLVQELGFVANDELKSVVDRFVSKGAMRVHVMPTTKGDKVTLFPLEQAATPTALAELGMVGDAADAVQQALAQPSGAFLVCGPVGSGTTSTLYAALEMLNTPDRVVSSIEDPIDRVLDGVDQVEVDVSSGVTFAHGLRTLLATDSDALLVGEIRDQETAEGVFAAALAGRHVLSGLRAPSAAAAFRRLLDMGLEPTVLTGALTCVVAQRLVRRVCPDCRETYYASVSELAELGLPHEAGPRLLARGRGCESCDGTGYRGRVGIFEVLLVTDEIRALVADEASAAKLHGAGVAGGMRTLRDEGTRLCLEGVTTSDELQRVLGADY